MINRGSQKCTYSRSTPRSRRSPNCMLLSAVKSAKGNVRLAREIILLVIVQMKWKLWYTSSSWESSQVSSFIWANRAKKVVYKTCFIQPQNSLKLYYFCQMSCFYWNTGSVKMHCVNLIFTHCFSTDTFRYVFKKWLKYQALIIIVYLIEKPAHYKKQKKLFRGNYLFISHNTDVNVTKQCVQRSLLTHLRHLRHLSTAFSTILGYFYLRIYILNYLTLLLHLPLEKNSLLFTYSFYFTAIVAMEMTMVFSCINN